MKIAAFKHFSFDDESAIAAWARREGHELMVFEPPSGIDQFPRADALDMLIVLGGPMSVYQEAEHPWLKAEKSFLRECVAEGKAVLGICLGAQMLAEVLGGRVYRNAHKEIGWHAVKRTAARHPLFDHMPDEFVSCQWHGDAFTLPEGAVRLAGSEACPNQAFAFGDTVIGLQFHLETTPDCIGTMLDVWSGELTEGPYIQSARTIAAQTERSEASHAMLHGVLDRLALAAARRV